LEEQPSHESDAMTVPNLSLCREIPRILLHNLSFDGGFRTIAGNAAALMVLVDHWGDATA
jgi:hypothetical protein